jgi:porphobilinogen synthase
MLFGIPAHRNASASDAYHEDGIVQRAVRAIKEEHESLMVITDVCMCQYNDTGHCGILKEGVIENDASLSLLAEIARSHARAGADAVAPSDMMDGRVAAIRAALDHVGRTDVPIISYAAKYASSFYGPFRDACDSAPRTGDRATYQMDYRNAREAIREVELDVAEGADIIMVKPALSYLDVIWRVRQAISLPVMAYNVSGEYAMVKAAASKGFIDGDAMAIEMLTSIRRAGADMIATYFALDVAEVL